MSTINSAQLREKFDKLKVAGSLTVHMKSGRYLARPVIEDETILTIVAGKLETLHVGNAGDLVLQNIMTGSSAERYIIDAKTFGKRYEKTGDDYLLDGMRWDEVEAKGIAEGICVQRPSFWTDFDVETFTIPAPWAGGEDMLVQRGDWILRPVLADLSVPNLNDIYRVEKAAFEQTYAPFVGKDAERRLARFRAERAAIAV